MSRILNICVGVGMERIVKLPVPFIDREFGNGIVSKVEGRLSTSGKGGELSRGQTVNRNRRRNFGGT